MPTLIFRSTLSLFGVLTINLALALPAVGQDVGPGRGSLVIVGGAMRDPAIVRRFLDLAGGPAAPIVVVPTAGEGDDYGHEWAGLRLLRDGGATNLTVLHTRDRAEADTEAFAAPLGRAQGVWFSGGRQWRLADAYLHTRVHRELRALLDRGGVVGGSSAGASIQASFLVRGDTKTNELMMGDHQEGFGLLRNVAIDQHLLRRNRQFDLLEVIEAHPELLGIGIDENTAIVVTGDEFDVIGQGYVVIYDRHREVTGGGRFYFLAPGDVFNLRTREAFRATTERKPLERIVPRAGASPK